MAKDNRLAPADKYALTIDEAALYYGIGSKKIRQIVAETMQTDQNVALQIGNKTLVKRRRLEEYLDQVSSI